MQRDYAGVLRVQGVGRGAEAWSVRDKERTCSRADGFVLRVSRPRRRAQRDQLILVDAEQQCSLR